MPMKMYVGVTDFDWFKTLKQANCDEVNFWKPGGRTNFKALNEGDIFLFKTHSPRNYIVGGGFFLNYSILPTSLAWDAFGIANGANSLMELNNRVYKYKRTNHFSDPDPQIGCIILSMPFYFDEKDWIAQPENWNSNIVQGKTYQTSEPIGLSLYEQVQERLRNIEDSQAYIIKEGSFNRFGKERIIKPRVGQGAFKVMIADAYHRRCAITGEKTLPVLEAAHIKPYSLNGPHEITNGLLLRSDFHTLFDRGYITIDKTLTVEVSHHIKEDFGNGKEYYAFHGSKLAVLPDRGDQLPNRNYLEWHNENVYLG
ncbi:HNH endonuclease [Sporolactobacillus spathodeae]|uniref:Restriction endonuclease n=2 Tax=Sporolactobacillus spathodeae TaxID=1465502 RepID=A0ABS2Q9I8_9BACL|nr:HNH endonuclease [Sporolactobacillus spathodeae]MBM7658458.1 putative restriction endonuclease [Sporolactobacillus spathodeae]